MAQLYLMTFDEQIYCNRERLRETLIYSDSSFPRRREPSQINKLDPRLRGDDE